ncbi:MAG: DUF1659 domain-containing protein [Peptococcales bacterium]|jgi:hypothetical protein
MAIITTALGSRVQVIVKTGEDEKGNPILKTRTYNRVKADASDDNIYEFATTIASLQKHPLDMVDRVNEVRLTEV